MSSVTDNCQITEIELVLSCVSVCVRSGMNERGRIWPDKAVCSDADLTHEK